MLDPQAQALMQLMVDKGVPPVNTLSPAEARESYRSRRTFTQPDALEVFKVENTQDLSSLESLKALPGVILVPDLKFARARRM